MMIASAVVGFLLGHSTLGIVIFGAALFILCLGLVAPVAYRPIHRAGQWLGRKIGLLLTHLTLVPLYYLVFLPVAGYLRLRKRDPLQQRQRSPDQTCWIPRMSPVSTTSYEHQFMLEDKAARLFRRPVGAGLAKSAAEDEEKP
jgi:hypothetical protein